MKKLLEVWAWTSGAIGAIMMILGVISRLAGGILWQHRWSNYFYPGGVFIVLGVFLFIGAFICKEYQK